MRFIQEGIMSTLDVCKALQILCDAMERSSNQWNFMVCPFQNLILHNPVFSWTGFLVFRNQTKEAINRSPGILSDFATQRYGMSQNDISVGVIFINIHLFYKESNQITDPFYLSTLHCRFSETRVQDASISSKRFCHELVFLQYFLVIE